MLMHAVVVQTPDSTESECTVDSGAQASRLIYPSCGCKSVPFTVLVCRPRPSSASSSAEICMRWKRRSLCFELPIPEWFDPTQIRDGDGCRLGDLRPSEVVHQTIPDPADQAPLVYIARSVITNKQTLLKISRSHRHRRRRLSVR